METYIVQNSTLNICIDKACINHNQNWYMSALTSSILDKPVWVSILAYLQYLEMCSVPVMLK